MGYSFGIKCEKCDYTFNAVVGHGMLGCGFLETDPHTKKPYFCNYIKEKRILDEIYLLLKTKENVREDENTKINSGGWNGHGLAQYVCTKCGRLHNKFHFRLAFSGGTYEPGYFCDECKGNLSLTDIEHGKSKEARCPTCGHTKLTKDENAPYILYD